MKKRGYARVKKQREKRPCLRMIVRASNAVIYGRENARAPPQSKSAVNSGEFSGLRCFYNSENTHSHGESAVLGLPDVSGQACRPRRRYIS